jgi:hypothetical protein
VGAAPRADEPELRAVFSENRIIDDPSPLPATVGGDAFVLGMAPNGDENLKAQAPESFEPRSFGQSVEQLGRDILVPSAHPGEFMAMSASKECGKHESDDFAQQLLLGLQATFDLYHPGIREI